MKVKVLVTLWTAAYQAPPSMGFSRQEYWSGLPLPSPPWRQGMYLLCSRYSTMLPAPGQLDKHLWSQWMHVSILCTALAPEGHPTTKRSTFVPQASFLTPTPSSGGYPHIPEPVPPTQQHMCSGTDPRCLPDPLSWGASPVLCIQRCSHLSIWHFIRNRNISWMYQVGLKVHSGVGHKNPNELFGQPDSWLKFNAKNQLCCVFLYHKHFPWDLSWSL